MNLRSARSFAPRLRSLPARPLIQLRGKATAPFRLPDPRNEPNVREIKLRRMILKTLANIN